MGFESFFDEITGGLRFFFFFPFFGRDFFFLSFFFARFLIRVCGGMGEGG